MPAFCLQIDARAGNVHNINEREIWILLETKLNAIFTISSFLCGQQVRLFVKKNPKKTTKTKQKQNKKKTQTESFIIF